MNRGVPINIGIIEFTRRIILSGTISVKGILRLPLYFVQLIPALPLSLIQRGMLGNQISKVSINTDPVFIIGHFRSGTTYLQKLLTSTQQFGFLTNYDCLFPNSNLLLGSRMKSIMQRLLVILKIKNPFFNEVIVDLNDPGEEDDYLMNKASVYTAYWGMVFPKMWRQWLQGANQFQSKEFETGWKEEYKRTIKYITWKCKGKQLLLKSPPNTERIRLLLELFPQAKFIYLSRNPYHLFYSMRNMWTNAILNTYSLQRISQKELHEIIFNYFDYLVEAYNRDKVLIPKGNLYEVTYEQLKENPYLVVQDIYASLALPKFQDVANKLRLQIDSEKGYRNFRYKFDPPLLDEIRRRWKKHISSIDSAYP